MLLSKTKSPLHLERAGLRVLLLAGLARGFIQLFVLIVAYSFILSTRRRAALLCSKQNQKAAKSVSLIECAGNRDRGPAYL
jgi:hypothetical protein